MAVDHKKPERAIQLVQEAGKGVEKARLALLRPAPLSLDVATRRLMQAADDLRDLVNHLKGSVPTSSSSMPVALRRELATFQRSLCVAKALLDSAREFHDGWARIASLASTGAPPGYTASGEILAEAPPNSLVMHG